MPSLNPELYTVAWIAPLEIEARAALCIFDEIHDGDFPVARGHDYVFSAGRVCGHNVVLATLPPGQPYGAGSAGALAGQVKMAFPNLWFGLLVGVAAGLPNLSRSPPRDIRLGDVLVALPEGESAGLIAYDPEKQLGEDTVELLHSGHVLSKTETVIRSAIGKIKLKAPRDTEIFLSHYQRIQLEEHADGGTFVDPGQDQDILYDLDKIVDRPQRPDTERTRVWYGPIGSGEKLMRDATRRNALRDQHGVIGLEMEAAGTMNTIPVGVIRGVCDYADSNKNKRWQPYASAMAAAYAKAILGTILPRKFNKGHFVVPFGRNPNFVGRQPLLEQLLKRIPPNTQEYDCQRTVIEGLGGVGKTQVVLEAAYRVSEKYPDCSVFWVPAVDSISFENAYREIGKVLQLQGLGDDRTDVKTLVRTALSQETTGQWLLIVDNADDLELLFAGITIVDYLPFSRKGSVLITTRNHKAAVRFDAPGSILTLGEMSQNEAAELFKTGLNESQIRDDKSIILLLEFLAYLPLAIKQASAYIAETQISTAKYLEYCQVSDEATITLLSEHFEDRTRYKAIQNPVATTWLISFSHILRDMPLAATYLRFICYLAEKNIPVLLLPLGKDKREGDKAISTLKGYAFIMERDNPDSFDIHRLVRLAMRNWLKGQKQHEKSATDAVQLLSRKFPFPKHENRHIWIGYLPHAQTALEFRDECTDKEAQGRLLFNVGESNYVLGKYADAEKLYREVAELYWEILGQKHPFTLDSMNNLAVVLRNQGKYLEAEQIHRQTHKSREEVLGRKHPSTLSSMNNLALVLGNQGKFSEAEQIHRQTLELTEQVLGREHPSIFASMNNLALVLHRQGNYSEAEQIHRQTSELTEEVLGQEHPFTLDNMSNLAVVLRSQGKYEDAEQIHRRALYLFTKVSGREHPSTLASMNNLALVLGNQGKFSEAEQIHRQTLELAEQILGREHPSTLTNMNNLALVLYKQGKYSEAEQIYQQAKELREEVLG